MNQIFTCPPTSPMAGSAADEAKSDSLNMGSILMVEDNELVSESIVLKLERLGYAVTVVATPADAIALLETSPHFDLVFTDARLPGKTTGAALAREIQRRWPALKILGTSGYPENMVPENMKMPEGVRLLAKPYKNAEFTRAVREAMAG